MATILTNGHDTWPRFPFDSNLGDDDVYGRKGKDRLKGGFGGDRLYGGDDSDRLEGESGSDKLYGGSNSDYLDGGADNDLVDGGSGNDQLYGDLGDDKLYGGKHNDTLDGGLGSDLLDGGSGNDTLTGGSTLGLFDVDTLIGGTGNDSLLSAGLGTIRMKGYGGTPGEIDTLKGSLSKDTIVLGESNSVFYQGAGYAVIKDFNAGQDKVLLEGQQSNYTLSLANFGVGTNQNDTVLRRSSNNDVIAVFADTSGLALNSGSFVFG